MPVCIHTIDTPVEKMVLTPIAITTNRLPQNKAYVRIASIAATVRTYKMNNT